LKATLDCLECIVAQALRAARVATPDEAVQRQILNETVRHIPAMNMDKSPAELSLLAYELAARLTGNPDPYRDLRFAQNELALTLEPEIREMVRRSQDPLSTALHLAAAGNVMDLGVQQERHIDVRSVIEQVVHERFAIDHTQAFRESLAGSNDLVYLLDNAGEIVFDKILIEELLKYTSVTAVVKGGPIINDVLRADAGQVALAERCEVIDNGGAFVGSPLDLVPASVVERLTRANMIVGKGQGNYETLDEFPGNVFLILRAKCEVIARHMGVRYGQVALISTRILRTAAVRMFTRK
jgi:uncharacterized protein with ATP-grasp and redox domains